MREFATWLSGTEASQFIQATLWLIPAVQSVHILAIGVVLASVFMIDLRIMGWIATDQSVAATARRFGPWLWGGLIVLALTGLLLIIGEPVRELLSVSFWLKMGLLAVGVLAALLFQRSLRRNAPRWESAHEAAASTRALGLATLAVWIGVVVLGRFIAWDADIWGRLSPQFI